MLRFRHRLLCGLILLLLCSPLAARAQREPEQALSDREVETLRDTADQPQARLLAFVTFVSERTADIDKLNTGRRQPGREEDIHERMTQATAILNDLEDNLGDYSKRHKDVRKVLPKVLAATERWATQLRAPAEDERYKVARRLALEAVSDVREEASKMVDEQKAYFLAHPPEKEDRRRER